MAEPDDRPRIVLRRRRGSGGSGGGHHGGAWKVAYADFVTAMMAFFLLMWLMNATTERQRKGIADFFSPSIPVHRVSGGGDGALAGDSVFTERTLARSGAGASVRFDLGGSAARGDAAADAADAEEELLQRLAEELMGRSGEAEAENPLLRHVRTRLTDEGLIVELFDLDDAALFRSDTAEPEPVLEALAGMLAEVFATVRNRVSIAGFVRSRPVVLRRNPVWELSTARAGAVRVLLEGAGLAPARLVRLTGWADRRPAVQPPMTPRNNRLEIVLLRSDRQDTSENFSR